MLVSLFTMSCNDELAGDPIAPNSPSNLHVLVPTINSAKGNDQSDNLSNNRTYNATVDECQINDLRLYAFPIDGKGSLIAQNLPAPLASMMLNENIANYQLTIEPGKYHIYVVANMSKILEKQNITSEESLKNQVLRYTTSTLPGLPIATNIPMIYEPEKDAEGNPAVTTILPAGEKYTEVAANLKFTCVKVKLNIIFDPTVATSFGTRGLTIKSILGEKLSPFTSLYWGNKFVESAQTDNTYKTGFESTEYDDSNTDNNTDAQGMYYTDWTDNRTADNSKDDIIGSGNGTKSPVNSASKWLFQGTYYLPERYITQASDRSYLQINGQVGGSVDNNYHIDLGHRNNEQNDSEVPTFPRGTFYEITGDIKTFGNMSLDCNVSVKDWEPVQIDADFNHTTLWVSSANAEVSSTTNDSITFQSNAANVEFGCDNTITVNGNEKAIIVEAKRTVNAAGNDIITFRVNPEIPISAYPNAQRIGTAKVWLKANNLKKYIDVKYNVAPYFNVTPEDVTIYYVEGAATNTKKIEWETNLGGAKMQNGGTDIYQYTSTIGNSTIKVSFDESTAHNPTGTFSITATSDPVTTTVHEFTVYPKETSTEVGGKKIRVTVRPPIGDYRIYFRAINDLAWDTRTQDAKGGHHKTNPFQKLKTESYGTGSHNDNWYDGWDAETVSKESSNTWNSDANPSNHLIYIYTQIGETEGTTAKEEGVWRFTQWNNTKMTADNTNPGWYYYDLGYQKVSEAATNGTTRTPKPGETLLMFHNNQYPSDALHRCPQHLEPGIQLFDYEDREGWILYDPTGSQSYYIYDEKPTVRDITITIYTKKQIKGWYKMYGVANDKGLNEQFTLYDNIVSGNDGNTFWSYKLNNSEWYITEIHLKAVDGNHDKDIQLKFSDSETFELFNGNSYEKYNDTGYYDNRTWHHGKPAGVN